MPNRITPDLASVLGKDIADLCPQGFDDSEANHCAHFVSHMGGYQFGFLCNSIAGSSRRGMTVRVQELFPHCPEVGKFEDLPDTEDDVLVFITAPSNVNLARKTIENVPRKHIGILHGGQVFHYSNGEDKVVRQTPDAVRTRFRRTYADQTVDLFFGTLPAVARAIPVRARTRGAGVGLSLKLTRSTFTKASTIGDLSVNGKFECHILEDPVRPAKIAGITAIPAGFYSVVITHSPKFGRDLPLLEDVPNFEGIRIQPGNSAADTLGCLLPGRTKATDFVGESRAAFGALFGKIIAAKGKGESVQIEIVESGSSPFTRSRGRTRALAPVGLFRVLADPLRVRSTPDAEASENVTGSLAFGQIVAANRADAAPGWMAVKSSAVSGLVPEVFLESVPVAPASKRRRRGKTRGAARDLETAAPSVDLFRVKASSANLRSVAGVINPANVLAALPKGHLVAKIAASPKPMWWEVKTTLHENELKGFMHAGLLVPDIGDLGPATTEDSDVQVSEKALQMILKFEGMDQPSIWPGTQSGISLGHGYDLGFHSREEFIGDWEPYLTEDQLKRLAKAIGKTGTAAKDIARDYADITIKRPDADAVFMRSTLPKIKGWAARTFPGVTALPADAQGALVSLVYNRGPKMEGERRREMREVRDAVANSSLPVSGKLHSIAASIRSMKRLWPDVLGLRRRRDAEADLVESAV